MRPAAVLSIPLAFAFIFVGVSQVNALQDISKPLTTGAINELWGTTTFLMLLLGCVALVTGLAGAMIWALRRQVKQVKGGIYATTKNCFQKGFPKVKEGEKFDGLFIENQAFKDKEVLKKSISIIRKNSLQKKEKQLYLLYFYSTHGEVGIDTKTFPEAKKLWTPDGNIYYTQTLNEDIQSVNKKRYIYSIKSIDNYFGKFIKHLKSILSRPRKPVTLY